MASAYDTYTHACYTHAKITMVADGDASVTTKLGLVLNTGAFGGVRSKRYAMLVDDGTVKELDVCVNMRGHIIYYTYNKFHLVGSKAA